MGSIFRYISDSAAKAVYEPPCDLCGRSEEPCYRYCAADASSIQYSEIGACAQCIVSGKARKHDRELAEIAEVVEKHSDNPERLMAAYNTTPDMFRINGSADWPICCGDWCEYIGNPDNMDEARLVPETYQEWQQGPFGTEYNAVYELWPEMVEEVLLFRCISCEKQYHIHNCT